jgi:hypothetical protein
MMRDPSRCRVAHGQAQFRRAPQPALSALLALFLLSAVVLSAFALSATAAQAATTGTITGTVTAAGGNPIAGTLVDALFENSPADWTLAGHAVSGSDGTYTLSGLPAGTYRISFSDVAGGYQTQYDGDMTDFNEATSITLTAGAALTGIDAAMVPIGTSTTITGRVTDASGQPLAHIVVFAAMWSGQFSLDTWTASDGSYEISGLFGVGWRVCFACDYGSTYATQYWKGAADPASATELFPTVGTTTSGIDATMPLSGGISGKVTTEDGEGLAGIVVCASLVTDNGGGLASNNVPTASDGTYDISGLPPGTYRVQFTDYPSNTWQYYDDAPDIGSGTDITVTAGATTSGIDAVMSPAPKGGNIAGTVKDATGGVAGIDVDAYQSDGMGGWQWAGEATSSSDGGYLITGLATGSYRVEFSDESGALAFEYYNDQATMGAASDVNVTVGLTTWGINATLSPAAHITGSVKDASAHGLADIDVAAYQADGSGGWQYVTDDFTSANGAYDLAGLAGGSYRLQFSDYSGTYATQYYNDAPSLDRAASVTVAAAATKAGIDAVLAPAGHITGSVTDGNSHGLGHIDVTAYQSDGSGGWQYVNDVATTSGGTYDIGGLDTGTYRLQFTDYSGTYATGYYSDADSIDSAKDVTVVEGQTTTLTCVLRLAGRITGTVTDASGKGLADIDVTAYDADGDYVNDVVTASDGSYDLGGLTTGKYWLGFDDESGAGYVSQYYDAEPSLDMADSVSVTVGATTANVDATLMIPGSDTTPPVSTVSGAPSGWVAHSVALALSAKDNVGGSGMSGGLARTEYKLDGGSWTIGTSITVPAPADHSGDGTHTVTYRSCDAAGNWETAKAVTVKIDTTPPVTSVSGADTLWHSGAVTLGFAATDGGGSGVVSTTYQIDGGSWTTGTSCQLSVTGAHTVSCRSTDAAGNVETAKQVDVLIDAGAPSVLAGGRPSSGWSRGIVNITLAASGGPSGAVAQYSLDGGAWATATSLQVAAAGSHTMDVRALSGAGVVSATISDSFTIDLQGPTTQAKAASGRTAKPITLRYEVRDDLSPRAQAVTIVVRNAHGKAVKTLSAGTVSSGVWHSLKWTPKAWGSYTFSAAAKDLAGNKQTKAVAAKVTVK